MRVEKEGGRRGDRGVLRTEPVVGFGTPDRYHPSPVSGVVSPPVLRKDRRLFSSVTVLTVREIRSRRVRGLLTKEVEGRPNYSLVYPGRPTTLSTRLLRF